MYESSRSSLGLQFQLPRGQGLGEMAEPHNHCEETRKLKFYCTWHVNFATLVAKNLRSRASEGVSELGLPRGTLNVSRSPGASLRPLCKPALDMRFHGEGLSVH